MRSDVRDSLPQSPVLVRFPDDGINAEVAIALFLPLPHLAGENDDLAAKADRSRRCDDAKAVELRHARIGDEDVEFLGVFGEERDRGPAIGREPDAMARGTKGLIKKTEDVDVVVRAENS